MFKNVIVAFTFRLSVYVLISQLAWAATVDELEGKLQVLYFFLTNSCHQIK